MTTAKKWLRLLWYAGFFLLVCYVANDYHGWRYALWLLAGGLFYHKASKAFEAL